MAAPGHVPCAPVRSSPDSVFSIRTPTQKRREGLPPRGVVTLYRFSARYCRAAMAALSKRAAVSASTVAAMRTASIFSGLPLARRYTHPAV